MYLPLDSRIPNCLRCMDAYTHNRTAAAAAVGAGGAFFFFISAAIIWLVNYAVYGCDYYYTFLLFRNPFAITLFTSVGFRVNFFHFHLLAIAISCDRYDTVDLRSFSSMAVSGSLSALAFCPCLLCVQYAFFASFQPFRHNHFFLFFFISI